MTNYINKNNISNFILALLTYLALKLYNNFSFYSFFAVLLFFVILYFYNKKLKFNKKICKFSTILSVIFSIFLSIGNIVGKNMTIKDIGFLNFKNVIYIILMFVGFFPFFKRLFILMFKNLNKICIKSVDDKLSNKESIFIFFLIFLSWFLFFLRYFPAIMTPDSYYVIHYANDGILSDHHTFGFTLFFRLIFSFGKVFFKSLNASIGFYTIFQMLFIDLIFTLAIKYLSNIGLKRKISYIIVLFIAINPLFSHYSVTLWRDVLFSMSFVIICFILYNYVINDFKIKTYDIIIFTLSIIMMLFFRNNGIYVFIFMSPFLILIGKNKRVHKIIYCFVIILLYFYIKGPVFDYFNVSKGLSSESYSIPIQQISRVVASNKKLTSKEYDELSKFYDVDFAKTNYVPKISDNMKGTINSDYLNKNKVKFFKIYTNLFLKYPKLYFEAYLTQTLGYWYPDVDYWTVGNSGGQSFFEKSVKQKSKLPEKANELLDFTISKKIPFSMIIWSIGLNLYILIVSTAISIYKNGKNHILYYVPIYGVWFTLLIATPVFCELRYIYSLFVMIPFYIFIPFVSQKNK